QGPGGPGVPTPQEVIEIHDDGAESEPDHAGPGVDQVPLAGGHAGSGTPPGSGGSPEYGSPPNGGNAEEEEEEDESDAEVLAALARCRSEARRRQSASPRSKAPSSPPATPRRRSSSADSGRSRSSTPGPGSIPRSPPAGSSPPGSSAGSPPGSPPGSPGPPQVGALVPPLFQIATSITGFNAPRNLTQAETDPWPANLLSQWQITALILSSLSRDLVIPSGWLFPGHVRGTRKPIPGVGYRDDLITGANIQALINSRPWTVLANPATRLTFDLALHRGAQTRLGRIADAYLAYEDLQLWTYWETTHYLPITRPQRAADPLLEQYHAARHHRRIAAGERWRHLLRDMLPMFREQWADVDLLLDPFFLHLPTIQDEITWYPGIISRAANAGNPAQHQGEPNDLLEALVEADTHDHWRNHYRDRPQDHPARRIGRLVAKFNPATGSQPPP
ncbi:hypothetical protein PF001_g30581, partial [Phytophthora fragariae]